MRVEGNTDGLKPGQMRRLERLFRRRTAPEEVASTDLTLQIADVSRDVGRQVGVLIDRRGQVEHVFVGDAHRITVPEFGRLRAGRGRLRGLRLVHTHLRAEPLTRDDLTDLARLRLDLVAAIEVDPAGRPGALHAAHLVPDNDARTLWRVLDPAPALRGGLDVAALVRDLEADLARSDREHRAAPGATLAVAVHVAVGAEPDTGERIAELRELAHTAGVALLDVFVQRRPEIDPRYLVGRGKLQDIVLRANQLGAELLVFEPDMRPSQARAISDFTDLKVIDRTMLILDIFAQRARSRDGKVQVELAQLRYALPRLVEKNTMMSRLTGGIGGRGPGETKLEISRRRARERIAHLERQIAELSRQRERKRARREGRGVPVVGIVGYTNAGKSTLLNTLTESRVFVEDRLFATLDPTARRLRFPRDREIVLIDTVGFIRDLPADLARAFRATLEVLYEADLLVHVVDGASPAWERHVEAVERILGEMDLGATPRLRVLNKADLLDSSEARDRAARAGAIPISALDAETTRPLLAEVERRLWQETHPSDRAETCGPGDAAGAASAPDGVRAIDRPEARDRAADAGPFPTAPPSRP